MVDIPGYGKVEAVNAASESTLQDLVKALTGKGGSGSTGGASGSSGGASLPTKEVKNFSKEIEETTTIVDDLGSAASKAAKGLLGFAAGAVGGAVGAITEFGSALMSGTGKMGELGAAIPLIGGPLGALGTVLDDTLDGFRSAANVGASFGNDMLGVTKAAANAGMTVDQFSAVLAENSNTMSLLGASTTEGAQRFAELSKGLRTSRLGDQLFNMGYSIEGINEGFLNYTDQMARQGRLQGMSDAQLREGTALYLEELDELAKVTGVAREELERQRDAAMNDARVRMMANNLEGEARENFLNNIAQLNTISPTLAETFVDLADGNAKSAAAQRLLATDVGQQAQALAADMAAGRVSSVEFNNRLAALGPGLDNFFQQMDGAQLDALKDLDPELYALAEAAGVLNRLQVKSAEDIAAEQAERNKLTSLTSNFQQTFLDLQGKIKTLFLESPLFENLSGIFADMIDPAKGAGDLFDQIRPKLEEFMNWINGWVNKFMEDPAGTLEDIKDNIVQSLKDGVGALFSSFLPSLDTVLIGAVAGIATLIFAPVAAPFLAIGAALTAMFGWETIKEWVGGAWDSITGMFDGISDWWSNLSLSDAFTDAWNGLKDWFSGLFDFNFEMPNFSDYLPKWLGGEGKPLSSLFGSDAPDEPQEVSTASQADIEEELRQRNIAAGTPAQSTSEDSIIALNTTMSRIEQLLIENNRLTRRTVDSVNGIGNLQG